MAKAVATEVSKQEIIETLNECRHPVDIAVFDSSNYFNLGTLIRTAHNFLVRNIYLVDNQAGFYEKATMGARKWENIHSIDSSEFFKSFSSRNIVACERRFGLESESLYTFTWPEEPLIVFGGEKTGVPEEVLKISKSVVGITVYGLLHDFNVASAGAVVLYDWCMKHYVGVKKV